MYAYTGGQRLFYVISSDFLFFLKKQVADEKYQKYFQLHMRHKPYKEDEFNEIMAPFAGEKKLQYCSQDTTLRY